MHEAFVLRDGEPGEYGGLSVHKAVENVNAIIGPAIVGMDVSDQRAIDERMIALDGTPDKRKLGGNAIASVSIACLRAAAAVADMPVYQYLRGRWPAGSGRAAGKAAAAEGGCPGAGGATGADQAAGPAGAGRAGAAAGPLKTVPVPTFNVINGGRGGKIIQPFNEFILVPYKAASIYEAVEIAVKCFQRLEKTLSAYLGGPPAVAGSYGWAAPSDDPAVVLGLMAEAAADCGYADKVAFALDCAASEMYDRESGSYLLLGERVSAQAQIDYVKGLSEKYPLVFVEDLLDENDWENYPKAKERIGKTLIIGDDLIVSNTDRLRRAYESEAIDGFILKPNQAGTLTEALDTHRFAAERGLLSITSGRSGGVVDDIVMDLSVGLDLALIKNGAPRSGERITKLNFLMRACELSPGCKMADISPLLRF
jgi:enolase